MFLVDGIEDVCVFGVSLVMYAFFSFGIFLIFHLSIWKVLMSVCVSGDILRCPSGQCRQKWILLLFRVATC